MIDHWSCIMRRGHSSPRKKIQAQLDASWKYKAGLRKKGVPLRDDLARAAFVRVLDQLAERLEKGEENTLERGTNAFLRHLPG
jgi:hypothetical protein